MAVQNTLTAQAKASPVVEYQAGTEMVSLTMQDVKQYLAGGNENVTDSEAFMFLNLCRYQHLNPFLREAYLIKYGTNPATMVVGKDLFIKRARHSADYAGHEAGIIIRNKETKQVEYMNGAIGLNGYDLCGGWARVYIKGMQVPIYCAVGFNEYAGRKSNGELNGMWKSKPATMIRKVALSQALREAFPDDLGGLYEPEEINTIEEELPETPVAIEPKQEKPQPKKPARKPKEQPKPEPEPDVIDAEVVEPESDEDEVAASLFG